MANKIVVNNSHIICNKIVKGGNYMTNNRKYYKLMSMIIIWIFLNNAKPQFYLFRKYMDRFK